MKSTDRETGSLPNDFRELCRRFLDAVVLRPGAEANSERAALQDAWLRSAVQLADVNERFEMMIASAKLAWWDHDFSTQTVLRSRQWAEMLGYTHEEVSSGLFEWKARIHPDDLPLVEEAASRHEAGETPYFEVEHRMRHKSGEWVWIQNWGKMIQRDSQGRPLRAVGFHQDITRRKRAELDREELIHKLQKTLNELKLLRGILPICSNCKRIRDDQGSWRQIELYIKEHSEAEFSHGICPECRRKLYGEPGG